MFSREEILNIVSKNCFVKVILSFSFNISLWTSNIFQISLEGQTLINFAAYILDYL